MMFKTWPARMSVEQNLGENRDLFVLASHMNLVIGNVGECKKKIFFKAGTTEMIQLIYITDLKGKD